MKLRSVRQLLLAGLSGVLYPLCFPNFDLGFMAWFVLVPLHLALDGLGPRRAFWISWWSGTIAFAGAMSWVVTAMHVYGKLPLVLSYVALAMLAAYLGLYMATYGAILAWMRRALPAVGFLGGPFVWVALEWIRTYLFSGLPWALLGYTQYQWLSAIQIADFSGVYGVSFMIVLVNAGLTEPIVWAVRRYAFHYERQPAALFPWQAPALAALGMVFTLLYGYTQLHVETQGASPDRSLAIGYVQANIDQAQKWDAAYRRQTFDRYARLTARAAPGADLVLWPEAATPFLFEQEADYREEIGALVRRYDVPLLFGSPAVRFFADGRPYLLNSAYLFSPEGQILGRYDKRHLVPFGEYIPLRSMLFFLDKLVEGIGDFEAGTVPTVLDLPTAPRNESGGPVVKSVAKFGVVICFEVIFPNLVREFARDGAEFMVTITNDAWFGESAAPFQHFGMVVFRAVENHIAFARAANTGISGFIDRHGRILSATPIFTEEAGVGRIAVRNAPTFYSRYGDVFAYGCVIIAGLLILASWSRTSGGQPNVAVVGATT